MGKRRKTAKTGDSAIYKSRQQQSQTSGKDKDDDDMYNEVDRFHNRREQEEYIRLDGGADGGSDEDDGVTKQEAILDLGGVESSSESEDDSSDDEKPAEEHVRSEQEGSEPSSSSESETEDLDAEEDNVRDWGRKKSAYYHGDTADLEIGQDEEDAFVEEEAAKEVLAARYAHMDEDDYALADAEDEEKKEDKTMAELVSERDLSKLSVKERHRLLQSHHPELLPLVSHFSQHVSDWHERTSVVERALLQTDGGEAAATVGATQHGLQWLTTRALLQASSALNVSMYLLLKAGYESNREKSVGAVMDLDDKDSSPINAHPVIARLHQLNNLTQKLEDRVDTKVHGLDEQLDNLVKASALMESGEQDEEDPSVREERDTGVLEGDVQFQDAASETSGDDDDEEKQQEQPEEMPSSDDEREQQLLLNDARFGLRMDELDGQEEALSRRKRKRRPVVASDFGDEQEDLASRRATQALASTVNAIEQRASTKSRKRRAMPVTEELDVPDEDADGLKQGLAMMEAELGRLESDDDGGEQLDVELDGELDEDEDFYTKITKKSKDKKNFKRELYKVAPKYPGIEAEVEGERAVSRQILKNRGLVAHKSKLNRNPRVKKREQYRKALVRRKGAVREVRTNEGHKYGGEETGIKSGLSRSRKLAR